MKIHKRMIIEALTSILSVKPDFWPSTKEVFNEIKKDYPDAGWKNFPTRWSTFKKSSKNEYPNMSDPPSVFEINIKELSERLPFYLEKTREIPGEVFTGPSLHFHTRAIEESKKEFLGPTHLEMIYAVLPAWGMHRMGETETKVEVDFKDFKRGILEAKTEDNRDVVKLLHGLNDGKLTILSDEIIIKDIVDLIFSIRVSTSESQIVLHSKILHHILPNLIPPIDRTYSATFMGMGNWPSDKDKNKQK